MNKKRTFYKRTDFSKVLSALDGTNPDQAQRAKKLQKNITSRVGLKVARYNRYKERQRTSSQKAHIQLAQQHPQFKSFPTVQTKQPFMLQNTKTMILPPQIQQQAMLLKQQQPPMQLKPQIKLQVEARQQAPVQQVQQIPKENQQGLPVIQQANVSKPQSGRSMVTPIEQISGPVNSAWDQQTSALHRMQFQQQMPQQPQSLSLQLPQQGLQVPQPQLQRKYQPMQIKVQPQPQQLQLQQQALVQHQPPSLPSQQKLQQQQPPQPPQQKYQQRQPQQQQP